MSEAESKTDSAKDLPEAQAPQADPPEVLSVERNASGQIVVKLAGRDEPIVDAKIARCFPWSLPEAYVSIRDGDGKEVALLETLDSLDDASRQITERELADKVFNPKITKILGFHHEFGMTSITAETDRGEVTFQIKSRDDVRVLSPTDWLRSWTLTPRPAG